MFRIRLYILTVLLSAALVFPCSSAEARARVPRSQQVSQQPAPSVGNAHQQPPERGAQSMSEANSRIQRSAEDLLRGDPQLSNTDVRVNVDDHAITLTGTVDSYTQHRRVMELMHQYSRYRPIVDKLQTK